MRGRKTVEGEAMQGKESIIPARIIVEESKFFAKSLGTLFGPQNMPVG